MTSPAAISRRRTGLIALLVIAFALRQDVWWWDDPTRVAGLPIGLAYHVAYCLAVSLLLWALVRYAWPAEVDPE